MLARVAGAYRVLENLVLVTGVHDNDRLQLSCFGDHASMETRATCIRFWLKNCEHAGPCSSNMRSRHDSMSRRATAAGAGGHVEQAAATYASSRKAR
jgi:nanoRNase/pAp phosphatase (c-di-AMP/oligoRNAs hydrolase)